MMMCMRVGVGGWVWVGRGGVSTSAFSFSWSDLRSLLDQPPFKHIYVRRFPSEAVLLDVLRQRQPKTLQQQRDHVDILSAPQPNDL